MPSPNKLVVTVAYSGINAYVIGGRERLQFGLIGLRDVSSSSCFFCLSGVTSEQTSTVATEDVDDLE